MVITVCPRSNSVCRRSVLFELIEHAGLTDEKLVAIPASGSGEHSHSIPKGRLHPDAKREVGAAEVKTSQFPMRRVHVMAAS